MKRRDIFARHEVHTVCSYGPGGEADPQGDQGGSPGLGGAHGQGGSATGGAGPAIGHGDPAGGYGAGGPIDYQDALMRILRQFAQSGFIRNDPRSAAVQNHPQQIASLQAASSGTPAMYDTWREMAQRRTQSTGGQSFDDELALLLNTYNARRRGPDAFADYVAESNRGVAQPTLSSVPTPQPSSGPVPRGVPSRPAPRVPPQQFPGSGTRQYER